MGGGGQQQAAQQAAAAESQNMNQQNQIISMLQNFSQNFQPQIQQLTNQMNANSRGSISTFMNQAGGTANPNALASNLFTTAGSQNAQATQGMESQLAGQQLGAYGSALSGLNNQAGLLQQQGQYDQGQANQTNAANGQLFASILPMFMGL
jgi:hypothetical protein